MQVEGVMFEAQGFQFPSLWKLKTPSCKALQGFILCIPKQLPHTKDAFVNWMNLAPLHIPPFNKKTLSFICLESLVLQASPNFLAHAIGLQVIAIIAMTLKLEVVDETPRSWSLNLHTLEIPYRIVMCLGGLDADYAC